MQPDFNSAILVIGAIAVLAALVMGGLRLFGNKTQTLAATTFWILMGVSGVAAVIWGITRTHLGAEALPDGTSKTAIAASRTTAPTTNSGDGSAAQPDLVLIATSEFLACVVPLESTGVPDGATASFGQMQAARATVIAYDAATTAYSNCVDSTVNDVVRRYAGVASTSDLQTLKSLGIKLHNSAVDKDQALANRLNQQIRVFKASAARSGQNDTGANTR